MADGWHYAEGERVIGPISEEQLLAAINQRRDGQDVLVWRNGFQNWQRAGDVPELKPRLAAASALPGQATPLAPQAGAIAQPAPAGFVQLWFGFTGRINRAKYWLVVLVNVGLVMAAAVVAAVTGLMLLTPVWIAASVLFLVLLVSGLAAAAKRLHDRDKSAWWILVFILLPSVISGIGQQFGEAFVLVTGLISLAISIWAFVELGCLRGTRGPNRFGPDPLEAVTR
jgi:uncharacterized membrane protein YhaH (DUF805 family)